MTAPADTVNTVLTKKPIKLKDYGVKEIRKPAATDRERRLAEALRQNLRKRKAQARESKAETTPEEES